MNSSTSKGTDQNSRSPKHFRARRIPVTWSEQKLEEVFRGLFSVRVQDAVEIFSLVRYFDLASGEPELVAIMSCPTIFNRLCHEDNHGISQNQWSKSTPIDHDGSTHEIILDTHFRSLTPLSSNSLTDGTVDFIAIHGLGSTPDGPCLDDSSYMWLCEALARMSGVRVFTYGYNMSNGSDTCTDAYAAARELRMLLNMRMKHERRAGVPMPPLVFITHSFGERVFKQVYYFKMIVF